MKTKSPVLSGILLFCVICFPAKGQNLLKIADSIQNLSFKPKLPPTWKDTRLIDMQTTKTVFPHVMEFRILHRFTNVGGIGTGGFHTLYGFDIASDIFFSFDFGITKNLMISISRSKQQELIDGTIKYRFLTQKTSGMPISAAIYGAAGITPEIDATLYEGAAPTFAQHFIDRLTYISELLIARRFNDRVSIELLAGLSHRNYVLANINSNNGATDENNIPYTGIGGRLMLTKHSGIVFDYYYVISPFRTNNTMSPYYNPLSIGYEIETGGHVFELNFTNASFLDENNIIPYTQSSWLKNGGFKFGFSISRVFNI